MKLNSQNKEFKNPDWNLIKTELNKIDRESGFLILESEKGDYIQCIGSDNEFIVELRQYKFAKFKHFIFGKEKNKSPLNVTWIEFPTISGQIMIHKEELLTFRETEIIFNLFFEKQNIPSEFNRRNVTKLHK